MSRTHLEAARWSAEPARALCGVSALCLGMRLELEGTPPPFSIPPEGKEGLGLESRGPHAAKCGSRVFADLSVWAVALPGQAAELRKRILIVALQKRSLHGWASVLWSAAVIAAQDSAKP